MRAIMVSVDYSDILRITLPYNRHHFGEVWVVTTPGSDDGRVAREHGARVFETDLFTAGGATFNKFRALEAGLDAMGREGWLCIMDADVLWPKEIGFSESSEWLECFAGAGKRSVTIRVGQLCTPLRRMWENWPEVPWSILTGSAWKQGDLPTEDSWHLFPRHRQQWEFAGYSQLFYASDPVLGPPPWHEIDWRHAGGADSFFQAKWPEERKVRPPFEVLHLGLAGRNWYGRHNPDAERLTAEMWRRRTERRAAGLDQFEPEKLRA